MEMFTRISQQLGIAEPLDKDGSVFVLGNEYEPYDSAAKDGTSGFGSFSNLLTNVEVNTLFMADVESRVFFTYRTQFTPIPRDDNGPSPVNFTLFFRDNPINTLENVLTDPDSFYSDIGWGCMIRTGQSLLANAIQRVKLTRDFRVDLSKIDDRELAIIRWFQDDIEFPLSLHKFVSTEKRLSGMKPGQWFGPSATARSIDALVSDFKGCGIDKCIASTQSADVYKDEVEKIFEVKKDSTLLLLFSVKLGVDKVNSLYWSDIFDILSSSFSVGIAGGKPSSSLYFFGHQSEFLFYLDPHITQQCSLDMDDATYYRSCHAQKFSRIHISETDPSMLIGMIITGKNEWNSFQEEFKDNNIIQFLDKRPEHEFYKEPCASPGPLSIHSIQSDIQDTGDYVDVGTFVSEKQVSSSREQHMVEEDYEDVKCKNQNILVCESGLEADGKLEVEQVLVEDSS